MSTSTQLIGYIRLSYEELQRLDAGKFDELFCSRVTGTADCAHSKPLAVRSHDYGHYGTNRITLRDSIYAVTVSLFQYLKSESLPLNVILRYTVDTDLDDMKVDCVAYDAPPIFMTWNGK